VPFTPRHSVRERLESERVLARAVARSARGELAP